MRLCKLEEISWQLCGILYEEQLNYFKQETMESDFFFFCNYNVGVLCRINLSERKRENQETI